MQAKENHIQFQKTGRYFTWGDPVKAEHLLIAIHGYGQLAPYFVRKFNQLDPEKYFVVCPEGPHRFYLSGSAGRVGASWMTKEDRLNDIDDYIAFLNTLNRAILNENDFTTKTLLGFSQGGATASRWIAYGDCTFDQFLLWAAVFPPDMSPEAFVKFKSVKNHFIIGTEDEYTPLEKAKEYHAALNKFGMNFEFIKFEGKHVIDTALLQQLI